MTSGWTIKPSMSWASFSAIETARIAASGSSASATFAGAKRRLRRKRTIDSSARATRERSHPRQLDEVERDRRDCASEPWSSCRPCPKCERLLCFADLRALHERLPHARSSPPCRRAARGYRRSSAPRSNDDRIGMVAGVSPRMLGHRGPARPAHGRAMAAKVPMPPPSAATNDLAPPGQARRARCRLSSSSQPATLKPKVMGRACWPCVRPACGTSR